MRLGLFNAGNHDIDIVYKNELIAWIKYSGLIVVTDFQFRHPLAPVYGEHTLVTSESKSYDNRKIVLMLFISLVFI